MSQQVRLYLRTRVADGSRRYLDPVFTGNNKLQPLFGLLNGQPQKFPSALAVNPS
jgi:hypothetical protein